jgi:similar to stage IV sporulation protein
MLIIKIWNFISGYVIIIIKGVAPERFINYLIARGIRLWNIVRLDYTTMQASVNIKDFKKIRPAARKSKTKVKIKDKRGLPFVGSKLRKRKMLIIGPIICVIAVFFLTSYVWTVEIKDNTTIDHRIILQHLDKMGINRGTAIDKIDTDYVQNQLLVDIPQLSWVGIEIKGVRLILDPRDRVPEFTGPDYTKPSNIIAQKDGIIEKIIVKKGIPLKKAGDVVLAGDIIISGTVTDINNQVYDGPAVGEVKARIQYQGQLDIPFNFTEYQPTKTRYINKSLSFFGYNLAGKTQIPFEYYEQLKLSKKPLSWRNLRLHGEIITEEYIELKKVVYNLTPEEAVELGKERILENIKNSLEKDVQIVNVKPRVIENPDSVTITLLVETLEEISFQMITTKEEK